MLPIMRPPRKAAEYFREQDPDSPISESFIRRLIRDGEIGAVMSGRKQFVSIEEIEDYVRRQLAEYEQHKAK